MFFEAQNNEIGLVGFEPLVGETKSYFVKKEGMERDQKSNGHVSVLRAEVTEGILNAPGLATSPLVVDGTIGGAGHSRALLAGNKDIQLLGLDRDATALERSRERLSAFSSRCSLSHKNFSNISVAVSEWVKELELSEYLGLGGILIDLGISSYQLDDPQRGLSFQEDGPLDMRLDQERGATAAELLNSLDQKQLKRLFKNGGVTKGVDFLCKEIFHKRPFTSTRQFAVICEEVLPRHRTGKTSHPATVPFQALRIAVNDELDSLKKFLDDAFQLLVPGGRLVVISFHSIEDTLVTRAMRAHARVPEATSAFSRENPKPFGKLLTKKATEPSADEVLANPRSRSARLRIFERGE